MHGSFAEGTNVERTPNPLTVKGPNRYTRTVRITLLASIRRLAATRSGARWPVIHGNTLAGAEAGSGVGVGPVIGRARQTFGHGRPSNKDPGDEWRLHP